MSELIAVSPCGHFDGRWRSDAHQLETFLRLREADVFPGHLERRRAKESFGVFDRLPPGLDRRQVPALAGATHRPQASCPLIVGNAPSDWETLEDLIGSELAVAEDAG